MKEIQSLIPVDSRTVVSWCEKALDCLKKEQERRLDELKKDAINKFRKDLFNRIFRRNITKKQDEDIMEWMKKNYHPDFLSFVLKNWNDVMSDYCSLLNLGFCETGFFETMLQMAKKANQFQNEILLSMEDFSRLEKWDKDI